MTEFFSYSYPFWSKYQQLLQLGQNTTEFVGPEDRKDDYLRLILLWIGTSPG